MTTDLRGSSRGRAMFPTSRLGILETPLGSTEFRAQAEGILHRT